MATTVRHRWRASVAVQTRARQLRRPLTPAEDVLWQRLRGTQPDSLTFRRQHPVDRFIVDFFCPAAKLVIETGKHPAILKDEVTTPGGTAINAIHMLETKGLRSVLIDAIVTATQRSQELSRLYGD